MNNQCVDCGKPTGGARCRPCNGKHIALEAARAMAEEDAAILAEGLSGDRLAERRNVSRTAAYRRIADARRRQALLAAAEA